MCTSEEQLTGVNVGPIRSVSSAHLQCSVNGGPCDGGERMVTKHSRLCFVESLVHALRFV